jgi:hypothetical protein
MHSVTHRLGGTFLRGAHRRRRTLLVLLTFILLTVVMTWPLAAQLGTLVPAGIGNDVSIHLWTFWWVKTAITEGRNPFYTDLLFHPHGVSLAYHNISWLSIAIWLPLQAIVGINAAYSLVFMGFFALNGFAMYLLAREWTGSSLAAFVGGLIYGFWPFTLSRSGQPNMIVVCWVPLVLLYLRRTLEKGRKQDAVLAAIFLALTGMARWHLLIMGGVIVGLYLLYKCLTDGACRTRRTLGLLVLMGLVTTALLAPLAAPIVIAQLTWPYPEDIFIDEQAQQQTDLLAYVLPNRNLSLWGDVLSQLNWHLKIRTADRVPFIGYTTIALALWGVVKNWRSARFWVLAAMVYLALALGPQLRINNQLYPQVPMPYRLVEDLFFIRVLRVPNRFNVFLGLPIGMLAAWGMKALLNRRSLGRRSVLLIGTVGILILAEYCLVPYRTMRPVTPAWYNQLAQEAGHFAVLDLPMAPRGPDKWFMLYQITHKKPLVEGHVSRLPREAFTFLDSTPFLKKLHSSNEMDSALVDVTHQLRPLAEAGVRYIILHKLMVQPDQLAAWQDWLTFDPYYEDEGLAVYRTDPRLGRDFVLAHQMTDKVGLIRATFAPDETTQTSLAHVDARWGNAAAPTRDYTACLKLINARGESAQTDCEPFFPAQSRSGEQSHEVVRSRYVLPVDPFLEPGTYSLTLVLANGTTGKEVGHPVVLGAIKVNPLPRVFTEPRPAYPLNARWGDVILLRGYDLHRSAESLELTVYWQAERRMDVSYKVFVHLMDPATGTIAVQDDALPRHWTYPTTWWERGEVVEDTISLPLDEVSPGQYRLVIGLYEPETGERLIAYSADGQRYADDAVLLTEIER